jgi:hypothetical protein
MKLYAIHAPLVAQAAPEKVRAARTGFSLAGFVLGPLWLLARGLWLPLVVYVALWLAVAAAVRLGGLTLGTALALDLLAHVYVGLEGRALRIAARARAGRPLTDVIYAGSALEAEKMFLERLLGQAAPARYSGAPASSDIIGLFPERGR